MAKVQLPHLTPLASLKKAGLVMPFVRTSPLSDLGWLLLLLPLWWLIGIEQFIWLPLLAWSAWKVVRSRRGQITVVPTLQALLLFLVIQLLSGFFIVEQFRYITFVRNLSVYLSLALLLFVVTNSVTRWAEIQRLLTVLVGVMVLAALVGILGTLQLWQPEFTSLFGHLLPAWITETTYGGHVAYKTTGEYGWFLDVYYFRAKSFFLFPTMYAPALVFTIPLTIFLAQQATTMRTKRFYIVATLFLLLGLLSSTGRLAMVALAAGFIFFGISHQRLRRWFLPLLVGCALFTMLTLQFAPHYMESALNRVLYARELASYYHRAIIFEASMEGAQERPLLGWGTERDIPDFKSPAGSHNYYLAMLYKHGVVGLLAFALMGLMLWRDTRPIQGESNSGEAERLRHFLYYGRWIFFAAAVNSLTEVLDLDTTTFMVLWMSFALLLVAHHLLKEERATRG